MKLRMNLSSQISLPISLTIFSSHHHLLLSNQQTHIKSIKQTENENKVENEISIESVNENHKSDQITTHNPSSQKSYHKIGEMKSEIK